MKFNGNKSVKNKKEIKFLVFLFFLVFMTFGFLISVYANGEFHQKSEQENGPGVYKPVEGGQAQTLTPDTSGDLQQNNVPITPLNSTKNSQTGNEQNNEKQATNYPDNVSTSKDGQTTKSVTYTKSLLLVCFIVLIFLVSNYLKRNKKK